MRPPHPGSVIGDVIEGIKEEIGRALTSREIADGLGITPKTLSNILNEHQSISSEMAIRLSRALGSLSSNWITICGRLRKK